MYKGNRIKEKKLKWFGNWSCIWCQCSGIGTHAAWKPIEQKLFSGFKVMTYYISVIWLKQLWPFTQIPTVKDSIL